MKSIIFDLDGTLADIEHRKRFITGEMGFVSWKNFNSSKQIAKDKPKEHIIELTRMYRNSGYQILIFTGRDGLAEEITLQWLADNNVAYDKLVMRPPGNHRPDTEMKTKWLNAEFPEESWKTDVVMAYEDRDKVVKMYREMGIPCAQVEFGDF